MAKSRYEFELKQGLSQYDNFVKALSQDLESIPLRQRPLFLKRIYDLAAEKVKKEWLKSDFEERAILLRNYRSEIEDTRAHLENAVTDLEKANSRYPKGLSRRPETKDIIQNLKSMCEELAAFEKKLASSVYPELRSVAEKKILEKAINFRDLVPGMNLTAIDDWFISVVEKYMKEFAVQKRIFYGRGGYNRIISVIFKAALGKNKPVGTVKNARRRIAEREKARQASVSIQNS